MEALTPIDEEPCEDLADDDQPITMIPRIMHTAPSPTTENPWSNITSTTSTITEKQPIPLASETISEAEELTNSNSKIKTNAPKNGTVGTDGNEISQIESVL